MRSNPTPGKEKANFSASTPQKIGQTSAKWPPCAGTQEECLERISKIPQHDFNASK
jgi:hypothetical protein